jgi:hypothetical protein
MNIKTLSALLNNQYPRYLSHFKHLKIRISFLYSLILFNHKIVNFNKFKFCIRHSKHIPNKILKLKIKI